MANDNLNNAIHDLRILHENSTQGKWEKGETSHVTVIKQGRGKSYHIANFQHAADAAFIDAAHEYIIPLLDELEALRKKIQVLEG